jgi:hypothetical protein
VRSSQQGTLVKGSLNVPAAAAGAHLEIDLLARAGARRANLLMGRVARAAVGAGAVSFTVKLNARGRSTLRRHRRLALTVKVTLKPTHGALVTMTRAVMLVR